MTLENPRSTARLGHHPIHPMLVSFPIVCIVGTLLTDIAYWRSANLMWANFSAWLISTGVILGVLAAIAGIIDFIGDRRIRNRTAAWIHAIGNGLVLVLAILNMFIHSRDGWNSVVPWGLTLSALSVLILLVTGWMGWSLVYRHRVGVSE